jgi:hypothetical protein
VALLLHLTRDSVAAGDDADAPHQRVEQLGQDLGTPAEVQALLGEIAGRYLPGVAGRATWIAWSRLPLLVLSSAWPEPRTIWLTESDLPLLDWRKEGLHVHFVYLALTDPEAVLEVARRSMSALRR